MMRVILPYIFLLLSVSAWSQDKPYHGDGIDDVLQHTPMAAAFLLKAAGMKGSSGWGELAVKAALSYALTAGVTYTLKHTVSERRPDGTDHRSFPSGHTAFAFSGATVLHKEYGRDCPWVSVAGYTVAAATAVDRIARNRHYWGDVVAGAAIGMASTHLSYWLGGRLFPHKEAQVDLALSPDGLHLLVMW